MIPMNPLNPTWKEVTTVKSNWIDKLEGLGIRSSGLTHEFQNQLNEAGNRYVGRTVNIDLQENLTADYNRVAQRAIAEAADRIAREEDNHFLQQMADVGRNYIRDHLGEESYERRVVCMLNGNEETEIRDVNIAVFDNMETVEGATYSNVTFTSDTPVRLICNNNKFYNCTFNNVEQMSDDCEFRNCVFNMHRNIHNQNGDLFPYTWTGTASRNTSGTLNDNVGTISDSFGTILGSIDNMDITGMRMNSEPSQWLNTTLY